MNTEDRDPMVLTQETAFCFGAIGLFDDAYSALVRERLMGEIDEVGKANRRMMGYSIKIDLPY